MATRVVMVAMAMMTEKGNSAAARMIAAKGTFGYPELCIMDRVDMAERVGKVRMQDHTFQPVLADLAAQEGLVEVARQIIVTQDTQGFLVTRAFLESHQYGTTQAIDGKSRTHHIH